MLKLWSFIWKCVGVTMSFVIIFGEGVVELFASSLFI